jgi:hypothetical protein
VPRTYRVDFKFVAPAQKVAACDTSPGTMIRSSSYDARSLTQTVVFQLASLLSSSSQLPQAACVQLSAPAAPSFVDAIVSTSRFVSLRRRGHELKAVVDQAISQPTPEVMPLVAAVNTAVRIESTPTVFAAELGSFLHNIHSASAILLTKSKVIGANTSEIVRAWLA